MIDLESMGPGQDQTNDPLICSQTRYTVLGDPLSTCQFQPAQSYDSGDFHAFINGMEKTGASWSTADFQKQIYLISAGIDVVTIIPRTLAW